MLVRTVIIYAVMTVCAVAFHEHTFAVFALRAELQMRFMNTWELSDQLKYVTAEQRLIVYQEIQDMLEQIQLMIDELIRLDKEQH